MIAGLYSHLVQSTLFAGGAALLNLLLRQNAAQVRHRIWLIASIKFLIPFSILIGVGELFSRPAMTPLTRPVWVVAAQQIVQPLSAIPQVAVRTVVVADEKDYFAVIALALWAAGFAAIALWWMIRWQRIYALRKSAIAITIRGARHFSVPVVSAPGVVEPGIVGIVRPVLLLPKGIENRLDPEQLDAVLAHEFAHVRRRDNLSAAIHMAAQATFWFHPLVWWLGMRLVEERERACDEEVLRLGIRPQVYASGILEVCRLYVESPLACVAGVTGSELRNRIEAIMKNRTTARVNLLRRIALAVLAIAAVALPVTLGIFNAAPARAQSPALAFEAASVRPTDLNARTYLDFRITGQRLVVTRQPLELIMRMAYGVRYDQILGGPSWMRSDQFDIEATAGREASRDEILAMLRTLLEDRFKLKIRHEKREGNVYVLTQGKGGHKLSPPAHDTDRPLVIIHRNTPGDQPGVSYTGEGRNATMSQLIEKLSGIVSGPVTDQTGITGNFDFKFDYATIDAPVDAGPSIFDSVQSQLGLKLEAHKAPIEVLVVDHAEKPSAN